MNKQFKLFASVTAVAAMTIGLSACASSDSGAGSERITYWASNQGESLTVDEEVLTESLDRFTEETGVEVDLEVISWTDLYNRILTAVTSGDGPDVLNIGNTWAVTLQQTGAFDPVEGDLLEAVGGADRFLAPSWATTGAEGETPTSVPIYGQAYSMYYNTALFADAGITTAPTTWDELVTTAKALTKDTDGDGTIDQWGVTHAGASVTQNAHQGFIRGVQNGGSTFDSDGQGTFDSAEQVAGATQFVNLMAVDKVMAPSDAELTQEAMGVTNLIDGKAGIIFSQSPLKNFASRDFTDWAVAPMPLNEAGDTGDKATESFVAGINLSVFKNSDNKEGAYSLMNWLTSDAEQAQLNDAYSSLPVVDAAYDDERFQTDVIKQKQDTLANHALPMPLVPEEGQMETLVGTALKNLFAQAATGTVTEADVQDALTDANNQMLAAQ
ncbi:extracellular solute-binding protein [Cryobacterium melibiosiphilum]|uniref:Extracellular solute-binding protein n=1 Tax=Cryobacterium melibiosiphilum TaxID=995039 RepID=A0A3A5MR68_9MICO|nr:extracellular solute-binding protein [Cryobacterium melibiosiphilum]RJT89668.1 extracellular solute-binding protein [Cryobacterium melibiosiphilum]